MKKVFLVLIFLLTISPLVNSQTNTSFRFRKGSPLPTTCAKGDVFFLTDDNTFYGCNTANTWNVLGGGGGSGSPGGSNTQVQFNDSGSFGGDAGLVFNKTTNFLSVISGGITLTTSAINKITITPPATSGVLTIADGVTLTASANANVSGTNTGDQTSVTGNAGTATILQTPRNINGVAFDGSGNITITSAAGTLSGNTLASGITISSITSFGTSPTIITPSITTGFTIGGSAGSRKIIVGNGTNFVQSTETWAVPGTSGNVLTSDGTNWTSAAPSGGGGISGLTTGNIPVAASSTTIADSVITQSSSLIGIGLGATSAPTMLTVGDTGSGNPRGVLGWQSSTDSGSSQLGLRKSRGTFASPSVVVTGDNIGRIRMEGFDGTSYINSSNIIFGSTGTIGTGRVPGNITFQVLPDVVSPVLTSVLTLSSTGIAATGLDIKSNASGSGVTLTALGGTNESIKFVGKGTGSLDWNAGKFTVDSAGTITIATNQALQFAVGPLIYAPSSVIIQFGVGGFYNLAARAGTFVGATTQSGGGFGFSSTTDATGTIDTAISRISAGLGALGTGAQGSFAGSLKLTNLISDGVVRLKGYTVATLPAGTQGDTAFVTDALAPTFLATIVGGGTVVTPVFFNGTAWVGY